MNFIWAGMILVGIVYGVCTGNLQAVTDAALDSSKEAVTLCVTMCGVMGFWVGLMEIAKSAGIIRQLERVMEPMVGFLFPELPRDHAAREPIVTNMIANILGLGWAATPAGLDAMEELAELEEERRGGHGCGDAKSVKDGKRGARKQGRAPGTASNEMCAFLVLNISSLQLIPVNVIAYRSQYGSANPTAIVGPAIVATAVSTLVAVAFCKAMGRKNT